MAPQADITAPQGYQTTFVNGEQVDSELMVDDGIIQDLKEGIWLGPVRIGLGLSVGAEYSDQQDNGAATDSSDDWSPFVAPSLSLTYDREVGPWTINARYAGGITYYTNPNYNSGGTSSQRNPLTQTGSFGVGHTGDRHRLTLSGAASGGTGFSIDAGENINQTNAAAALDWLYILGNFINVGAKANYSTQISEYSNSTYQDTTLTTWNADLLSEWSVTGKSQIRFVLGTGRTEQDFGGPEQAWRSYTQALTGWRYAPTEKIRGEILGGVAYVQGNEATDERFLGPRLAYRFTGTYDATAKTSIRATFGLDATDIQPDFRLEAFWRPLETTGVTLGVYQDQSYSTTSLGQFQINRGFVLSLSQQFLSKLELLLSAGYQQTENINLDGGLDQPSYEYGFGSAALSYRLNRWSSLRFSWWQTFDTGEEQTTTTNGQQQGTRVTASFNLTF